MVEERRRERGKGRRGSGWNQLLRGKTKRVVELLRLCANGEGNEWKKERGGGNDEANERVSNLRCLDLAGAER